MESSTIYIAIGIISLGVIALLVAQMRQKGSVKKQLTPLAGLAFGFVLAGILFGEERIIGYTLLGAGVLLAVIDMVMKLRQGAS